MSFILDALRKSESERQRDAAPGLSRAPLAQVRHRVPGWTWGLIGLLTVALIALALVQLRNEPDDPPVAIAEQPASSPIEAPSAVEAPSPVEQSPAETPSRLRSIGELPAYGPTLPRYRLDVLAHSDADPATGSAFINGQRYFVGDRIGAAGPELVEVRADGVVLAFAGERFLLRP